MSSGDRDILTASTMCFCLLSWSKSRSASRKMIFVGSTPLCARYRHYLLRWSGGGGGPCLDRFRVPSVGLY